MSTNRVHTFIERMLSIDMVNIFSNAYCVNKYGWLLCWIYTLYQYWKCWSVLMIGCWEDVHRGNLLKILLLWWHDKKRNSNQVSQIFDISRGYTTRQYPQYGSEKSRIMVRLWTCKWLPVLMDRFKSHLPLDKMAAISQTTFADAFLWMKSFIFWLNFSLKFVLKGWINNNPELV